MIWSPCSDYCPGADPFRLASTTASITWALTAPLTPRSAPRPGEEPRRNVLDEFRMLPSGLACNRSNRLGGEIVICWPESTAVITRDRHASTPAGTDPRSAPGCRRRRSPSRARSRSPTDARDVQGVVRDGVEPRSSEPTAITSAERTGMCGLGRHGTPSSQSGQTNSTSRRAMFA